MYVGNYTVDASIKRTSFASRASLGCVRGWGLLILIFFFIGHTPTRVSAAFVVVDGLWGVCFVMIAYVISSLQEHTVDALASGAEEGRSNLR